MEIDNANFINLEKLNEYINSHFIKKENVINVTPIFDRGTIISYMLFFWR